MLASEKFSDVVRSPLGAFATRRKLRADVGRNVTAGMAAAVRALPDGAPRPQRTVCLRRVSRMSVSSPSHDLASVRALAKTSGLTKSESVKTRLPRDPVEA